MRGSIVEPILLSCIHESSLYNIACALKEITPISFSNLKKYLFYLIEYEFVSYIGHKQVFTIKDGGFDLLSMIDKEKREERIDIQDIIITIERIAFS